MPVLFSLAEILRVPISTLNSRMVYMTYNIYFFLPSFSNHCLKWELSSFRSHAEVLGNQFFILQNFTGRNCSNDDIDTERERERDREILRLEYCFFHIPTTKNPPLSLGGSPSAFIEMCLL